jgi:hypothetical protein
VKKNRLVHTRSTSQLRCFPVNARAAAGRVLKSFPNASRRAYNGGMKLDVEVLSRAANEARGLAMDAVQASNRASRAAARVRRDGRGALRQRAPAQPG